ncbi:MAG: hypothetical protein KGH75_00320 [Rhodospirillales bacterium]|nr:hypothetical protein [Rhodospirillales bacterium]
MTRKTLTPDQDSFIGSDRVALWRHDENGRWNEAIGESGTEYRRLVPDVGPAWVITSDTVVSDCPACHDKQQTFTRNWIRQEMPARTFTCNGCGTEVKDTDLHPVRPHLG